MAGGKTSEGIQHCVEGLGGWKCFMQGQGGQPGPVQSSSGSECLGDPSLIWPRGAGHVCVTREKS